MLNKNEKKILSLVKLGPLFVIFFSLIITFIAIHKNNLEFKKDIAHVQSELLEEKKMLLKLEVQRVFNFIENEKKLSKEKIKIELKQRVYQAHAIATSIYKNNLTKSKKEITKLIKDALRDIRFRENRGYYFIDELTGTNILHPIAPQIEGKNILNLQDKRGNYIFKEMATLIKDKKEGFITWWWTKPNIKNQEFEKIGFAKYFEPYDWFIGTGEYLIDFEEELKKDILKKINTIRYGVDGYIFAYDYEGTTLSHIKKDLINKNRFNLKDEKGNYLVQNVINVAKKGENFLLYIGTIRPSTGKAAKKISFIKGIQDWQWAIGLGTYMSEIEDLINKEKEILNKNYREQIIQILAISFMLFIFIFLLSLYFAKTIENKFNEYKEEVRKKSNELNTLNTNLEQKVQERTKDLKESNNKLQETLHNLKETKKDLLLSEKMALLGELVGTITHEINSPLGMSITSISHLESMTKKINSLYHEEKMSEEDFENFINDCTELSKIISINLKNTSQLVKSFKNVAVDQAIEEKREFNIKDYIHEILLSLKSKTKKTKIEISLQCNDDIKLHTYPNFIFQILTNFINNSILHGFGKNEKGNIDIVVNDLGNEIELIYIDNGKGIPEELQKNIFDEYFTTKRGSGGTGLGLFIIKKIVNEKLLGQIDMDTNIKQGVKFSIKIPKKAI